MNVPNFPPELFDRRYAAPNDWPDNPDVRRALEWFLSYLPKSDWISRRSSVANHLFGAAQGSSLINEQGRVFDARDTFAWYLFLAESYLDHPMNYEYIFGSRVLPIFQALGRSVRGLKEVPGAEERVLKLIGPSRSQPNGLLFELLVAGAYLQEGYSVAMVAEQPGKHRTHDLDVLRGGDSWAVECKRMETSEYGEHERKRMRQLCVSR